MFMTEMLKSGKKELIQLIHFRKQGVTVVSTAVSQQGGGVIGFSVELACSLCVCVGSLWVLGASFSCTVHNHASEVNLKL